MRSRWLSTFTLLGILLIVLGIVGKVIGPRFVFDPGQMPDGNEAWYYIAVGALMVINGLVTPALTAEEQREKREQREPKKTAAVTVAKASPVKTDARSNL